MPHQYYHHSPSTFLSSELCSMVRRRHTGESWKFDAFNRVSKSWGSGRDCISQQKKSTYLLFVGMWGYSAVLSPPFTFNALQFSTSFKRTPLLIPDGIPPPCSSELLSTCIILAFDSIQCSTFLLYFCMIPDI